ncbi:MAG TPA: class I SAM-dependent methyltransferase [Thermoanaerobaculia bacterium]|nr:class I SAM-dependent methyltransferase [Thermoanaerobaculia bacterium]
MDSIASWNERYRAGEPDDQPAKLLVETLRDATPGLALDLACGAGRNAIWLAQRGWDMTAIDGSMEAIRILRERAVALRIHSEVRDLETDAPLPYPDASFDAVLLLYFLWRPLFAEAKRIVKPGGLVLAAIRTRGTYAITSHELRAEFAGWDLIHEQDGEIAEIVARRAPL